MSETPGTVAGGRTRGRIRSTIVGSVLAGLAAASLIAASPAEASHAYSYKLFVVRHSGMCLNVAHASPYDGAPIVQATCTGYNNERWDVRHVDTDWWTGYQYFEFRVRHTNKCLDVAGQSGAEGARLQQWGCWGGDNQQFRFVDLGNGYRFLIARHSNLCVQVAGGSYSHAAPVDQARCNNWHNQHWAMR